MDIKNFRLKNKKNYKQVIFSAFNDESSFYDYIAEQLSNGVEIIEIKEEKISSKLFLEIAKKTRELCSFYNALFFINDRSDIAFLSEADGIILSSESIKFEHTKHILGEDIMYGYWVQDDEIINQDFQTKYDFFVSTEVLTENISKPFFVINN